MAQPPAPEQAFRFTWLALGRLPEGFGLTPVESLSCGTPVVSTMCGALGELFPAGHGVAYVATDDPTAVIDAIEQGFGQDEIIRGQHYVADHYSLSEAVGGYLSCFAEARKNASRFVVSREAQLARSPWCRELAPGRVWHDLDMCTIHLTSREVDALRLVDEQATLALREYASEVARLRGLGVLLP